MNHESLTTANDIWMNHALKLAKKADNRVGKNPFVGCVIVAPEGHILGEGHHSVFGGEHAEVAAVNDAKRRGYGDDEIAGSKMYVTLEPCSHHGKTPPCTDLILKHKISDVVIGMRDPSEKVKGIELLNQAGVKTRVMKDEYALYYLNRAFAKVSKTSKPWLSAKVAVSIDGRMAMMNGESKWITGEKARADVHKLRSRVGAIISGTGTVLRDEPSYTARHCDCKNPDLYVIGERDIPKSAKIYEPQDRKVTLLKQEITQDLLCQIAEESNTNHILLECGPRLLATFLSLDLIDELIVYQAPFVLGQGKGMAETYTIPTLDHKIEWETLSIQMLKPDTRTVYISKKSNQYLTDS